VVRAEWAVGLEQSIDRPDVPERVQRVRVE
jgi:hypothetical protein